MERKFKSSFIDPSGAAEWIGVSPEEMMQHIEDGVLHFPFRHHDGRAITGQHMFLAEAQTAGLLGSDEDMDDILEGYNPDNNV